MTGLALRHGLSFCRPEGKTVFLDLEADRYFGLTSPLDGAFAKLVETGEASPAEKRALMEARILVASAMTSRPQPCPRPNASATPLPLSGVRAPTSTVTSALIRRLLWRARLRHLPLARNIQSIELRKQRMRPVKAGHAITTRLHAAYHQASMIMSARDQCLSTSLSLASWLLASGICPDLILGVKLNPFEAHCWVEVDDMIVADDPEHVRPFTPIWIV